MNKQQLKITAVALTLLIISSLLYLSINYSLSSVGKIIFILPFLIGFLPPYIAGGKYPMHQIECYSLSFISLSFVSLAILAMTFQTVLFFSALVVLPLLLPIVLFFSYLAFRVNDRKVFKVKDFFRMLPILFTIGFIF